MNYDLLYLTREDREVEADTEEYLNILYENDYVWLINDVTRVEKDSESCLDHIFLKTKM